MSSIVTHMRRLIGACCLLLTAGKWYMTLLFNKNKVAQHNAEQVQRLPGILHSIRLAATLNYARHPVLHRLSPQERDMLCRKAKVEVLSRLHYESLPDDIRDGPLYATLNSVRGSELLVGVKRGMPMLFSQRCCATVVSVIYLITTVDG